MRIHRGVKEIEPWGILFTAFGVFLALITFRIDYSNRVEERTVRAWQLLTTRAPGNSGKLAALEYLNKEEAGLLCVNLLGWLHGNHNTSCLIPRKDRTPLTGIDLSPPIGEELGGWKTMGHGAYLHRANLRDAFLTFANLTAAILRDADLSRADLSHAILRGADLSRVDLTRADLRDADLSGAHLNGAELRGAVGLVQDQLDHACGDKDMKLPEGLTIRLCVPPQPEPRPPDRPVLVAPPRSPEALRRGSP